MPKTVKPFKVEVVSKRRRSGPVERSPRNMWGKLLSDAYDQIQEENLELVRVASIEPPAPPPPPPSLIVVRQDGEVVFQEPATGKTVAVPISAAEYVRKALGAFIPNIQSVLWMDALADQVAEIERVEAATSEAPALPEDRKTERRRRAIEAAELARSGVKVQVEEPVVERPLERKRPGRKKKVQVEAPSLPFAEAASVAACDVMVTPKVAPTPPRATPRPAAPPIPAPSQTPGSGFELRPVRLAVSANGKKVFGLAGQAAGQAEMDGFEILIDGASQGFVVHAGVDKFFVVALSMQSDVSNHRTLDAARTRLEALIAYRNRRRAA